MKVLIVGGGGREHAIAYCVAKSSKVEKMYCAPGNAGIAELAECVPIGAMEFDKLVTFAKEKAIDLAIVGMDDPLVGGLIDEFEKAGIRDQIEYCQNDQGCNGNEDLLPEQSAEEIFILFFHCFFLTHVYSHLRQSYS